MRVTGAAAEAAAVWGGALDLGVNMRQCTRRRVMGGAAAADAWASGDFASLGGCFSLSGPLVKGECLWFRIGVHRRDIERWCPMHGDMADDIAFF